MIIERQFTPHAIGVAPDTRLDMTQFRFVSFLLSMTSANREKKKISHGEMKSKTLSRSARAREESRCEKADDVWF